MDFPHGAHTFRLIPYGKFDPVTNMAIDEAILNLHLAGKCPPTLRFYGWEPPSISFGYAQKVSQTTVDKVKEQGLGVVRRPTGGRAVLHEGELTYCFVASTQLDGSIQKAYKQICQAFIDGIARLGVNIELGRSDSAYKSHEDCFEATTQADLHYQGKKLIGSAQLRRKEAVLQHGSVIIDQGQDRMAKLLGLPQKSDEPRHACLADILGEDFFKEETADGENKGRIALEEAIGYGFHKNFDCTFSVYELTFEEWEQVDALKSDPSRYAV